MALVRNQPADDFPLPRGAESKYGVQHKCREDWPKGQSSVTYPTRGGSPFMMKENWVYRRGDIYCADLNPVIGSEQGGIRPVVVLQNDIGNKYSTTLIVAMVSTKITKKEKMPTHHVIENNPAFRQASVVLLEQIRTIDKKRIKDYLGKVTPKEMASIDKALAVSLAMRLTPPVKRTSHDNT